MPPPPSVYLAGPEVFLPDALGAGEKLKAICAEVGLEAFFPLDADPPELELPPAERARGIAAANEALIRRCDGVLANLTPFRGPSADPGTVYEVGFARALGKIIVAYTHVEGSFLERTSAWLERLGQPARRRSDGSLEDADHLALEDFGLVDNLMIPAGILDSGGAVVTPELSGARPLFELAAERLATLLRDPAQR